MAHEVETPKAHQRAEAHERVRKEQRDCFSCLTLLVLALVMVWVVGRLSFTAP